MSLLLSTIRVAQPSICSAYRLQQVIGARNVKRWVAPVLKELRVRRKKVGPEALTPRSTYIDWNYNAELFAFGKRLNETFDMKVLKQTFTHRSFIVQEELKQQEMGITEPIVEIADNKELIESGEELLNSFVKEFVKNNVPSNVPESLISGITGYLLSNEVLAKISSGIGTKDLILSADFPVTEENLVDTLKAVIGALNKCSGQERANLFIKDFICSELNQKDYTSWWEIEDPLEELKKTCQKLNLSEPEPRLIGECGRNTILAAFNVGIYCDKKLLGNGFGESVEIAIGEAAKDSLRELYKIQNHQQIIKF